MSCRKMNIISITPSSSNQNSLSKAVGLMRKISTSQAVDTFHQATSHTYNFSPNNVEQLESSVFLSEYSSNGPLASNVCLYDE